MSRSYECFSDECAASCSTGALLRRKEIKIVTRGYRRRAKEMIRELIASEERSRA